MALWRGRVGRLSGALLALTLLLSVLTQGSAKASNARPVKLPRAPEWRTAPRAMPIRPKSCPALSRSAVATPAKDRGPSH
jgi:hypothetical protein